MDIQVESHGSLYLLRPMTQEASEFFNETAPDDAQYFGNALVVEPRYVGCVVEAARDYGLTVR